MDGISDLNLMKVLLNDELHWEGFKSQYSYLNLFQQCQSIIEYLDISQFLWGGGSLFCASHPESDTAGYVTIIH